MRTKVAIIGGGLAGSLLALFMARRGWRVEVYERRDDLRLKTDGDGRSINLGLSARGIAALREVDLLDDVMKRCVPMRGRFIHPGDGGLVFQAYGTRQEEILHSILRNDLNGLLMDRAETYPDVTFFFRHNLIGLDPLNGTVRFEDGTAVSADLIVGADGAFSAVRGELERRGLLTARLSVLEWGYKELTIPPAEDGSCRTELEGLHVWSGGDHGLMVAHPNVEKSLTATMFLPLTELARLSDAEEVAHFLGAHYPDTAALMPDAVQEWLEHPVGKLVTVRTEPWCVAGRVMLIGDAAHAVYPFYGQGMNSSFEDCSVFDQCLASHPGDLGMALAEYQRRRKRHTDVLAELSERNFVELRDRLRSPWFRLRKQADLVLHRLLGPAWLPLYTMISHRSIPYGDALRRARWQDRVLIAVLALAAAGALFLTLR